MLCECTVEYSSSGRSGKPTVTDYQGGGIWKCPNCGIIHDHSEDVFKVKIEYRRHEDGGMLTTIIDADERLKKIVDPHSESSPEWTYLDSFNDDVQEDAWNHNPEEHELGVFEIEVFWKWSSYMSDYGEEWDVEMFVVTEKKLDEGDTFLEEYAKSLEPKTHCCECKRGERHTVCIQYPNCDCVLEGGE